MRTAPLALLLSALAAAPGLGQVVPAPQPIQSPAHPPADCYCRAHGLIFHEGEAVCLATAQGGRLAECKLETNVMSWSITTRECPDS